MAKHAKQRRRPIRPIRIAIRNLQGKSAKNIAPEMATMPKTGNSPVNSWSFRDFTIPWYMYFLAQKYYKIEYLHCDKKEMTHEHLLYHVANQDDWVKSVHLLKLS